MKKRSSRENQIQCEEGYAYKSNAAHNRHGAGCWVMAGMCKLQKCDVRFRISDLDLDLRSLCFSMCLLLCWKQAASRCTVLSVCIDCRPYIRCRRDAWYRTVRISSEDRASVAGRDVIVTLCGDIFALSHQKPILQIQHCINLLDDDDGDSDTTILLVARRHYLDHVDDCKSSGAYVYVSYS